MPRVRQYAQQVSSQAPGAQLQSAPSLSLPMASTGAMRGAAAAAGAGGSRMVSGARQIGGPGPRQQFRPTDSFGVAPMAPTAVAQGVQQMAQGMGRFAASVNAFQERVATTKAEDALTRFEREKNDIINGYRRVQGENAFESVDKISERIIELQKQYMDSLEDQRAQGIFQRASDAQLTRAQQDIMRHASEQFDVWETDTIRGRLDNTLNNASLYWFDDDHLAAQLELGRQTVIDLALKQGKSAEALAADLRSYNTQFAMNAIEAGLSTSSASGQNMLAKLGINLEGRDLVRIQELIDNKMKVELNQQNAATAMNITDSLIREYGHLPDARAQINEQISQIENEDLRQKTFREVDWQLAARNRAQAEERGAIFESAERYLMGGGSVDQFIADNPDEWELLSPDQQKQLLTGPVITTNFDTLAALTLLPPHELAKIEPSDYFSQLNDQDRRTLIKSVADAREGKNTGQVGRTQTAEVSSVINRIYGPPNSSARKKADANGQVDSFYAMVTAEHQHRIDLNGGKDLNSAQFTEMLNDLAGKITTNRTVFGINTPWTSEQTISTMPPESLAEISAGLRQDGIPVTAESLVSVYNERDEVWGIPMENLPELSRVLRQYNIPVTPETLTEAYRQATQ